MNVLRIPVSVQVLVHVKLLRKRLYVLLIFFTLMKCFYFPLVINCGDPGVPDNGERIGSGTSAGDKLNYDCKPGFKLIGASQLVCEHDGTWSAPIPRCDSKMV